MLCGLIRSILFIGSKRVAFFLLERMHNWLILTYCSGYELVGAAALFIYDKLYSIIIFHFYFFFSFFSHLHFCKAWKINFIGILNYPRYSIEHQWNCWVFDPCTSSSRPAPLVFLVVSGRPRSSSLPQSPLTRRGIDENQ